MTTEGVRVSWTSTDVRKYQVETGTAFNVKTIYLIATFIKLVSTVHLDQENSFLDLLKPCIMVIVV